ncbi:hypothetical protein JCM10213_001171 [Rhodosporidiobolus nylandii]
MAHAYGYGHPAVQRPYASTSSSFLPDPALPSSRSFADEVDLDMRRREAAATVDSLLGPAPYEAEPSALLFSSGERARPPAAAGGGGSGGTNAAARGQVHASMDSTAPPVFPSRPRPRSQSSPTANGRAFSGRDSLRTALPSQRDEVSTHEPTYGDDGRSMHLGGSRPASRVGQQSRARSTQAHRLGGPSSTSLEAEPAQMNALHYLYQHDGRHEYRAGGSGENGAVGSNSQGQQSFPSYYGDGGRSSSHGHDGGGNGHEQEENEEQQPRSGNLSKEEAWYLLRALVGQEIKREESLLWRMKNLDAAAEDGAYDEHLDPREAPILRYLIRHFLLTLPLIRDVSSPSESPTFWTDGLYPLIRAVHDADFSKPVDRGSSFTTSQLYNSSLRNALERFIAAGLKLSSSAYEGSSPREQSASVPMQSQTTSGSSRYNFMPTFPPPADLSSPFPPAGTASRRRDSASPSSSSTRRFSLGRLFGGDDRSPVKTFLPHPPVPALPPRLPANSVPSFYFAPHTAGPAPFSESDGEGSAVESGRSSAEPARPDSAVLPSPIYAFALLADAERSPPRIAAVPQAPYSSVHDAAAVEELDLRRSELGPPGATGLISRRRRRSKASSSESQDGEGTARFAGALAVPGSGDMPERARGEAPTSIAGAETDVEGFEYYPSDAAVTPTQENTAFDLGGYDQPLATHGEERNVDREAKPYVIEDMARPRYDGLSSTAQPILPPPVPAVPTSPLPPTFSHPFPSPASSPIPTVSQKPSTAPSTSQASRFGLKSLLKNGRRKPIEKPLSRPPAGPPATEEFVAHMALPAELLQHAAHDDYQPREMALPPVLVPKGGIRWPYDAGVPFVRAQEFERLQWGGFEADVVGVRRGVFSSSYIIRIRRPARLDEYVLRSDTQFHKFYRALKKALPQAHIRRLPAGDLKNDVVIRPKPGLATVPSSASLVSGMPGNGGPGGFVSNPASRSRSRLANGLGAAASDPYDRTSTRTSTGSTFARSLRAQSIHTVGDVKAIRRYRTRSNTALTLPPRPYSAAGTYRSFPATTGSRALPVKVEKKMPRQDARRRALRVWLRDTLSVRTVGHHRETAAFLLLGSIVPKDSDVIDIAKRELIDDARRTARLNVAHSAADRVKATRKQWSSVEKDIVYGDGLSDISLALRSTATIDKLPLNYQRVIESLRYDAAATLFQVLIASESSGSTFSKLKSLHAAFPYFLVKQALRIKGSSLMARALQDILLSRPFGGKSLLQKILVTCLDDDPVRLAKEMDRLQARIGSAAMCDKLDIFVHDSCEKKEIIRRYAADNSIELVLCIVRGADEPRLPSYELDRITRASKAFRKFSKTNPTPLVRAQTTDPDLRLVLDLQAYLQLASRDRDATLLREMLAQEDFAAAIEVVAQPFVALIRRTYKAGNGAQALSDLQRFLDQLIIIIEALRSRVQDPQKSIRIISRLLARHQQAVYTFIRSVHLQETLVEEFLQWAWTASVFLRRGLAEPINLDELVPPKNADEKAYLLEELEELVGYHSKKRLAQFQAACQWLAGDVEADDPIIVEGDGKGRSRVEPIVEDKPRFPFLSEIPLYAERFKAQLQQVFLV